MTAKSYLVLSSILLITLAILGILTWRQFTKPLVLTSLNQIDSDIISYQQAGLYTSQTKTVQTPVNYVFNNRKYLFISSRTNPHHAHMLSDDQDKSGFFTIRIYVTDLPKFPADFTQQIQNKTILATGKIDWYQGDPNIIITDPSQISII